MNLVLSPADIAASKSDRVGGKGYALCVMARNGMRVPNTLCLSTEAYLAYITATHLRDRILLELNRKLFDDMRWEEIWDASLRIRSLFLSTPMPPDLKASLAQPIEAAFEDRPVAVRSSALGEDSSKTSFAGLHESYLNIRGVEAILDHICLVWASLWSDRALLYRQELRLDAEKSTMAVVIQEMVTGERSGVVFGVNPMDESQAVIQAVHGLNQGLVEGAVEPDRWILRRATGALLSHHPARREKAYFPAAEGVRLEPLPEKEREIAPLDPEDIALVFALASKAETVFGSPQDVEWSLKGDLLFALQSRPITGRAAKDSDDKRVWYLSLRRSFEGLKVLRSRIEQDLIPAMTKEADELAAMDLKGLSDGRLAEEIDSRKHTYDRWKAAYWRDCIPFAHGMRLFGQIYNDVMKPDDPFEFMELLKGGRLISLKRNQKLEELASWIRRHPHLVDRLRYDEPRDWDPEFRASFDALCEEFGDLAWGQARFIRDPRGIVDLLIQMASRPSRATASKIRDVEATEESFLSCFRGEERSNAENILDVARASYKLRDDDNIYLGRMEGQLLAAVEEGQRRIQERDRIDSKWLEPGEVADILRGRKQALRAGPPARESQDRGSFKLQARQLVGQPAWPGFAVGKARVIMDPSELFKFEAGEVLVCDAVDPNMTFVVPLASGIVERRGGMLIHGAIIAREYGLPSVTGVPDVTKYVGTGDQIAVDGYLGVVIIGEMAGLDKAEGGDRGPTK